MYYCDNCLCMLCWMSSTIRSQSYFLFFLPNFFFINLFLLIYFNKVKSIEAVSWTDISQHKMIIKQCFIWSLAWLSLSSTFCEVKVKCKWSEVKWKWKCGSFHSKFEEINLTVSHFTTYSVVKLKVQGSTLFSIYNAGLSCIYFVGLFKKKIPF